MLPSADVVHSKTPSYVHFYTVCLLHLVPDFPVFHEVHCHFLTAAAADEKTAAAATLTCGVAARMLHAIAMD